MDTLGLSYARSFHLSKALIKLITRYPNHFKVKKVGNNQYWRDLYQTEAKNPIWSNKTLWLSRMDSYRLGCIS